MGNMRLVNTSLFNKTGLITKREHCTILKRSTIRNSLALFCTFIWKKPGTFSSIT